MSGVDTVIVDSSRAVAVALTVSTSPAYSSGDSIGGKITIAGLVRGNQRAGVLQSLVILDRANQKPVGDIFLFSSDPTAATITDNAAFVFSTDDLKVIARIPVTSGDWSTVNSKAVCQLSGLGRVIETLGSSTLYAAFVTTSTPTFAATTDVQMVFGFLRD